MGSTRWQNIWTACGQRIDLKPLSFPMVWRVVEDQSRAATLAISDNLSDQAIIEEILEEKAKPRVPQEFQAYHYLLSTPLRYPPLRYGSRFGAKDESGIWYGSLDQETVLSEKTYYLFLFLQDTTAVLEPFSDGLTVFHVAVDTAFGCDYTVSPFARFRAELSSKDSYSVSQKLGAEMRRAGVTCFTFFSARSSGDGVNVGIFHAGAFAGKTLPVGVQEGWFYRATADSIEYGRKFGGGKVRQFFLVDFLVKGKLPRPAFQALGLPGF